MSQKNENDFFLKCRSNIVNKNLIDRSSIANVEKTINFFANLSLQNHVKSNEYVVDEQPRIDERLLFAAYLKDNQNFIDDFGIFVPSEMKELWFPLVASVKAILVPANDENKEIFLKITAIKSNLQHRAMRPKEIIRQEIDEAVQKEHEWMEHKKMLNHITKVGMDKAQRNHDHAASSGQLLRVCAEHDEKPDFPQSLTLDVLPINRVSNAAISAAENQIMPLNNVQRAKQSIESLIKRELEDSLQREYELKYL